MVLQGGVAQTVLYACQMSGQVSPSCCCKSDAPEICPIVEAECQCCDVSVSQPQPAGSALSPAPQDAKFRVHVHLDSMAISYVPQTVGSYSIGEIVRAGNAPPPVIYLVNQSFRC